MLVPVRWWVLAGEGLIFSAGIAAVLAKLMVPLRWWVLAGEGLVFLAGVTAVLVLLRRSRRLGLACFAAAGLVGWLPVVPELGLLQLVAVLLLAGLGLVAAVVATWTSTPRSGSGRRRVGLRLLRSVLWAMLTCGLFLSVLVAQAGWDGFMWGARSPEFALWSWDGSVAFYVYERSEFPDPIVWPEVCERWGLWRIDLTGPWPGLYASDMFYVKGPIEMGRHSVRLAVSDGRRRVWIDGVEGEVVNLNRWQP
jgi:hypothetical protein